MNNPMMVIVVAIAGLFFGLVAGIYASKSNIETRDKPLPTIFWAFLLIFGAAQGIIFCLMPKSMTVWIFVIILGLLTVFQIMNQEGKYRMASWDSLAILATGLLIFSITGWMDEQQLAAPKPEFFFFIIPAAAPFIAGAIRVATMGREPKWKKVSDVDFKANLIGITCTIGLLIGACGIIILAFS